MRRWWALAALTAGILHGSAVIRGTVVENDSGHPLARSTVTLLPVSGMGTAQSVRCNSYGSFEFKDLPAGVYMVSAARLAFAPVQYGQKRWHSAGMPITVMDNDAAFLTIRLPRYGAITGTVVDENDVGLPAHDVAVYTNTRPPHLLARAKTDDRGMYRLFGLTPGSYLVRSMSKLYEDGGYVPTFYRDSATVDASRPIEVTLDQQVDHIDIHPAPGRLYTIAGRVQTVYGVQPTVSLSSDTGTEFGNIDAQGNFTFNPAPAGQYELFAQGVANRNQAMAGFMPLNLDRDLSDVRLPLSLLPTVQFVFEDTKGQPVDPKQLKVMARRKDIAGEMKTEELQVVFDEKPPAPQNSRRVTLPNAPKDPGSDPLRAVSGRVPLLPGRWDVALAPTASYCVVNFTPPQGGPIEPGRSDGWNEILLAQGTQDNVAKFVVSSSPATLSGTVKGAGGDVLAGVPVFLEPYDLDPRKRLSDIRSTRTNGRGIYQFGGLAPGVYRVLGTFEYQLPEPSEMESAHAKTVKVEEGSQTVFDLDEFVIH